VIMVLKATDNKTGFTLVEIMVATLLLAVLALGGAASLYHAGAVIRAQQTKQLAIHQAVERMELLKRTNYSIMQPDTTDDVYYYRDQSNDEMVQRAEIYNTEQTDNTKIFPMISSLRRVSPVTSVETESLLITVNVSYGRGGEAIILESTIVPDL